MALTAIRTKPSAGADLYITITKAVKQNLMYQITWKTNKIKKAQDRSALIFGLIILAGLAIVIDVLLVNIL